MTAYQWQTLTRFAGELNVLPPGANTAMEAARYLRYHHGLSEAEWREVETFARGNRTALEAAEADARNLGAFAEPGYDDGTGYDASTVGQVWRLLFGFAAQYTLHAAGVAERYLCARHSLGEAEWEAVQDFLTGQEHYRSGGESPV